MTKKLSLVTSALLITSSAAFADSNSIKEAFANGSTSGDLSVYTEKGTTTGSADSGFTAGSVGVNYETDSFNGFSVSLGFRGNHELGEEKENDYEGNHENSSIVHTAAIKYANDDFSISAGRQEIDLEWLGDYNEGVVVGITAIPDTTVVLGYTNRQAAIAEDESKNFARFDHYDGSKTQAYVADVKYEGFENTLVNPYYYTADGIANYYGLKVEYNNDMFGITGQFASSSEDNPANKDGEIIGVEARANVAGFALALGHIATDSKGGVGSITALGENISPTEEIDDQVYGTDASSTYGSIGYTIADIELGALYVDTEYLDTTKKDANELTLTAGYNITEELALSLRFTDYEVDNVDSDKIAASIVYSF